MNQTAQISASPGSKFRPIPGLGAGHVSWASEDTSSRPATAVDATMNQSGFDALVRAYSADLFRFGYWLCRDRWQAQDLVQETFAAAWKGRDSLRDRGAAKAWLFSILRNEHVRVFQKKRLHMVDRELEDLDVADDGGGIERVELDECLHALPEHFREPLLLQILGGFSGREIATMLNLSEQNVMTRLTRARQALQQLASPNGETRARKSSLM